MKLKDTKCNIRFIKDIVSRIHLPETLSIMSKSNSGVICSSGTISRDANSSKKLSFCSKEFIKLYQNYLFCISSNFFTSPEIHLYEWIVPNNCSGYCKKIKLTTESCNPILYKKQFLKNPNIVYHPICKKIIKTIGYSILSQYDIPVQIYGVSIADFILFKLYIKNIIKPKFIDLLKRNADLIYCDNILDTKSYHNDFKKYKLVSKILYNDEINGFRMDGSRMDGSILDDIRFGLSLINRNTPWKHCDTRLIKLYLLKRIIGKILSIFTTKNMTKLISYHI